MNFKEQEKIQLDLSFFFTFLKRLIEKHLQKTEMKICFIANIKTTPRLGVCNFYAFLIAFYLF